MVLSTANVFLDQHIAVPTSAALGAVVEKVDIQSSLGPFRVLPKYKTRYPEVVIRALGELYAEYNRAFGPLLVVNREWDTDYQYCRVPNGTPINGWVQIDMVGLPQGFLSGVTAMPQEQVREILRGRIFEIENSLAMYQLLERIFSSSGESSLFREQWRRSLNELRQKHGMPVALLAVTEQKHHAMKASEFGKGSDESPTDEEVRELSGFDRLFGPEEFRKYLTENGGECGYLLYARTSDPVEKLRKPDVEVDHPLLSDPEMRRVIKAYALTFNVDVPGMDYARRINDTKEYLLSMGMAFLVGTEGDLYSPEFAKHVAASKPYAEFLGGSRLSPGLGKYLLSQGVDLTQVESGDQALRGKPLKGTYGGYGHVSGELRDREFRHQLRRNLLRRGPYVLQPELQTPNIVNETDGREYTYIDRNFFATDGQSYSFMGGVRLLMPLDSTEAQSGRIHGNAVDVLAEIF